MSIEMAWGKYRVVRPTWYLAWGPQIFEGEVSTNWPQHAMDVFNAQAMMLGATPQELRHYLDRPWSHGDLYYIQKLVYTIRAHAPGMSPTPTPGGGSPTATPTPTATGTPTVTPTPTATPTTPPGPSPSAVCRDLNADGRVDVGDVMAVAGRWGATIPRFDLDGDGLVDLADVQAIAACWRQVGSPFRRVNAPYFSGNVRFAETAIFWFGAVNATDNYADVRVGYNDGGLYVRLALFDRRLWYDTSPTPDSLTDWDAVTLYLNLTGSRGHMAGDSAYRFVAQLTPPWLDRAAYQAAYRGNGNGWIAAAVNFTTESAYRGTGGLNQDADNRGWALTFHIPFASLGLSGPPPAGSVWGMALTLHDRDDAGGTPIAEESWPERMVPDRPATWGQLRFGLPSYTSPAVTPAGSVVIRHGLNGATVVDAAVGGGSTCGNGVSGNPAFAEYDLADHNLHDDH